MYLKLEVYWLPLYLEILFVVCLLEKVRPSTFSPIDLIYFRLGTFCWSVVVTPFSRTVLFLFFQCSKPEMTLPEFSWLTISKRRTYAHSMWIDSNHRILSAGIAASPNSNMRSNSFASSPPVDAAFFHHSRASHPATLFTRLIWPYVMQRTQPSLS